MVCSKLHLVEKGKSKTNLHIKLEFPKSCAKRIFVTTCLCASAVYVPTCLRINMPAYQRAIRRVNVSTWHANVPKGVPIFSNIPFTKCYGKFIYSIIIKKILRYALYYRYTYHMYMMYRT